MKQVFVSYAYEDAKVVRELHASLRDTLVSGWMDRSDIASGEVKAQSVKESLRRADAIVVLVSERSLKSQWVQFEVGAAFAIDKPIIPILVGRADLEKSLPAWLQGIAYIDARKRPMRDVAGEVARALSARGVV
jgi:hypothetical protein